MDFGMTDYVRCTQCGETSLAPQGTDVCPCCGFEGGLMWGLDGNDSSGESLSEEKVTALVNKEMPFWEKSKENAETEVLV